MHWQPVAPGDTARIATPPSTGLLVWWWPETSQPAAATRRLRTDTVLRHLLAPCLAMDPAELRFGREAKGRPYLLHPGAPDFNFSDTPGGSVVAVATSGRVGIDIERTDRAPPVQRLAARWFATDEAEQLAALAPDAARRAFLALWTAKEASCKATGTGIFGRLAAWRFAIDADAGSTDADRPRAVALPSEAGAVAHWRFHRLAPAATHTVALSCHGNDARPELRAIAG